MIKIMGREKGIDFMKRLSKQDLMFRNGHGLLRILCEAGELPIVVVNYLNNVLQDRSKGAPIDWVRFESFPIITAIHAVAIVSSAPHPNAAKLFYNFILSRDGARVFREVQRIPARTDEQPPEIKGMDFYVAYPHDLLANYT